MKAGFIEPMLLLTTEQLPDSTDWLYEVKLDGYRALAIRRGGKVGLRSRNDKDFTERYASVVAGFADMPDETVLDGELVALDDDGKPSFQTLQNYGSGTAPLHYYVFDVLVLKGRDVTSRPLHERRRLLEEEVAPLLAEPVRRSPRLQARLVDLIQSVKAQGLEGLVAKRLDSRYEAGERSGAWRKMRVNRGQELVIGGYTPSVRTFDALVIGYYRGGDFIYAARTRNGFTPAVRSALFPRLQALETERCPFANLPEKKGGRWGAGLTVAKMKECRWIEPRLVAQFEFVEWTSEGHLRHVRYRGLREDKRAEDVVRE